MKYFYTTLLLLVCFAASSQNLYWIGGPSGNWNNPANWSAVSGGPSASTVPGTSNYAVFNTNATVTFDVTSTTITGLHILNASNVKLVANDNATLTVTSTNTSAAATGLYVAANAVLTDSMTAYPSGVFTLQFGNNAKGTVDGMLVTTGDPGTGLLPNVGKSRIAFNAYGGSNNNALLTINGTYKQMNSAGATGLTASQIPFWVFSAGSTHWINSLTGGNIGPAVYDNTSTIHIGGDINTMPVFSTNLASVGNVVVDIVSFGGPSVNNLGLVFPNNLPINGNLTFRRTANAPLLIAGPTVSNSLLRVNGNLVIESPAQVAIGSYNDHAATLEVAGNVVMSGGTLYFRKTPTTATTYTTPTVLKVFGNIQQTDGSITTGTVNVSSPTDELFVVEMAGTTAQTISATGGDWDNTLKNIVLRINNSLGVTTTTNVRVSKVSWNSANAGIINTSTAAPLTILNPSTTDATVMNNAGSTGYVDGPVRRVTNTVAAYVFPTGDNGVYRPLIILPEDTNPTVFEAQYWNEAFANLNTSPIMHGISNQEYWRARTTSGTTNASVQLTLNNIVPGTNPTDGLVVASYNGSQWVSEYAGTVSNMLVPGNVDEGQVQSEYSALNRYYTFGFGTAATLPIELKKFNVSKINNNQASVEWEITTESTPVSFVVERSLNGVQFTAIATVNVTSATQYQYIDTELPSGRVYYRLRMIDQDGSATYSDIQSVQISNSGDKVQLYPTISNTQTQIKLNISRSAKITLVVSDNSGRIVQRNAYSVNAGTQMIPLNVSTWANGVYYVVVLYEDGTSSAPQRFIKQ
ncbi:T9SS type A sorting domain-containing protein [Gynurincola endophyticus]|uniref:T9SS type A sorting domain-containing protein n=1 Tax=Gynurincola endophyticus TaxID=2479004 RepID=UPI000F8C4F4D|nr:T9SS type A sorting domain-containing protein [Gynurincola endophyticus]